MAMAVRGSELAFFGDLPRERHEGLRRARQATPLRRDERPSLLLDGLMQHFEEAEADLD